MQTELNEPVVKAIQDSVAVQALTVGDDEFVSRQVFLPPAEPTVKTLGLSTLDSLVQYLEADIDGLKESRSLLIHIEGPASVAVVTEVQGRHAQRDVFVRAKACALTEESFEFAHFYSAEEFVTKLQALFKDTDERGRVLKIVGNITEEKVKTSADDGITQKVVAKAGVAFVAEIAIQNPFALTPYRTFPEVAQVESDFILRVRAGRSEGDLPTCALFEADGGRWKLEAVKRVREYLEKSVKDVTVIA
jgi:hypothetical protein